MPSIPPPLAALLAATGLLAAWTDWRRRRIPNWLTISALALGIALQMALNGVSGAKASLAGAGVAFLVYLPLYLLRAVGGGDLKLMTAAGAIGGPSAWLFLFVLSCLVGGVVAITMVLAQGRLRRTLANVFLILRELAALRPPHRASSELDVKSESGLRLPRGVVIGLSITVYVAALAFGR